MVVSALRLGGRVGQRRSYCMVEFTSVSPCWTALAPMTMEPLGVCPEPENGMVWGGSGCHSPVMIFWSTSSMPAVWLALLMMVKMRLCNGGEARVSFSHTRAPPLPFWHSLVVREVVAEAAEVEPGLLRDEVRVLRQRRELGPQPQAGVVRGPGAALHGLPGRAGDHPGAVDGGAEEGQQPEGGQDPGDRPPRHWACLGLSAAAAVVVVVVQAGGEL